MIFYIINNNLSNTIIYNTVGEKLPNLEFIEKFFIIMAEKTEIKFEEINIRTSLSQIATNNITGWEPSTSFDLELENFIIVTESTNVLIP